MPRPQRNGCKVKQKCQSQGKKPLYEQYMTNGNFPNVFFFLRNTSVCPLLVSVYLLQKLSIPFSSSSSSCFFPLPSFIPPPLLAGDEGREAKPAFGDGEEGGGNRQCFATSSSVLLNKHTACSLDDMDLHCYFAKLVNFPFTDCVQVSLSPLLLYILLLLLARIYSRS